MEHNGGPPGRIEHGFPHLPVVRASITALFRRLTADGVRAYATSVSPAEAAFDAAEDLHPGARRVASAMVRALRLPDARTVVAFRPTEQAATVEPAAGPEYFVEVDDRFRTHRRDLPAALSHEVAHVLLHRLGLEFPDTADNEILTDTAAVYLGAGRLLLDAYREDALTHQKRLPHPRGVRLRPRQARGTVRRGPLPLVHQPPGVRGVHDRKRPGRPGPAPGTPGRGRPDDAAALREGAARGGGRRGGPCGGRGGVPLRAGRDGRRATGGIPLSGVRAAAAGAGARAVAGALRAVRDRTGMRHLRWTGTTQDHSPAGHKKFPTGQ